jgi:hypothetical protein
VADALQHGQCERGGFAGSRRGLPEQISSLKQQRNRFALDGRGLFITQRCDDIGKFARKSEGRKAYGRGGCTHQRRSAYNFNT